MTNCMTHSSNCQPAPRGFTFIEVMFAVLVMGVGVIMIAAMLPVALKQTQETRESAAAASVLESHFHEIETSISDAASLPATWYPNDPLLTAGHPALTPRVLTWPSYDNPRATDPPPNFDNTPPTVPALEQTFAGRVSSSDPAFAAIPFYVRGTGSRAELALVAVRARNIEQFPQSPMIPAVDPRPQALYSAFFDFYNNNGGINPALLPLPVVVQTRGGTVFDSGFEDAVEADQIALASPDTNLISNEQIRQALVQGAAVVVPDGQGKLRVFRLAGPARPGEDDDWTSSDPTVWNLDPEGDLNINRLYDTDPTNNGTPGDLTDDFNADEFGDGSNVFPSFTGDVPTRNIVGNRNGYLIGRMLQDPAAVWNADDNPYIGPSQVVGAFEGQSLQVR